VGNEIVRIGTLEHEHLDGVVGLGSLNEGDQIADQFGPQKIHGRGRNFREQNGPFQRPAAQRGAIERNPPHPQALVKVKEFVLSSIVFANGQHYEIKTRNHICVGPVNWSDVEGLKTLVVS
jgi:hypothetical protein